MVGIIGAMTVEVEQLVAAMEDARTETKASMDFCRGRLFGCDVTVVKSGIGKVNAGICSYILASEYKADAIINTGIGGSLDARIDIGDIVLSTDTVQHDVDGCVFGYEPGQIPQMDTVSFTADEKLISCAEECCSRVNPDIKTFRGRVLSGDQFISDKIKKKWLIDTFGGMCADMEGAAIGQGAYLCGVPFLIVRAISDKADDSASMDSEKFEAEAVAHTTALIKEMVKTLG